MSDRLYTCDLCIREGHEEVGCHYPNELIQAGENVVCQNCLECGEFPELDDLPQERFIPPEDRRIAELEARLAWHYPAHNLDVPNLPEPGQKVVAYYRSGDRICGPVVMGDLNRDDGPPTIAGKSIYQPVVRWCRIPEE